MFRCTSLISRAHSCPWQWPSLRLHGVARPVHVQSVGVNSGQGASTLSTGEQNSIKVKKKLRLDDLCLQQNPQFSKNVIQSWIAQGKVLVDGRPITKSGHQVSGSMKVVINAEQPKYVCRAGLKMESALEKFDIDVTGLSVLDSGLSTGGFTDCLLQNGAAKVFGVDVGYGQVAEKIRVDPRVVVIERFNLRYLKPEDIGQKVQLVTLDLSFISVLKVIPAVVSVMEPDAHMIVLIKPHFEAGRHQVQSGGVVRDPEVHKEVIERVTQGIMSHGFDLLQVIESPILGDKGGNKEFLAHLRRNPELPTAVIPAASEPLSAPVS